MCDVRDVEGVMGVNLFNLSACEQRKPSTMKIVKVNAI
jgi:hypothetical protein